MREKNSLGSGGRIIFFVREKNNFGRGGGGDIFRAGEDLKEGEEEGWVEGQRRGRRRGMKERKKGRGRGEGGKKERGERWRRDIDGGEEGEMTRKGELGDGGG